MLDDPRIVYPYHQIDGPLRRRCAVNGDAMYQRLPWLYRGTPWLRPPRTRQEQAIAAVVVLAKVGIHVALVRELGHGEDFGRYLRHLWRQGRTPDTLYEWQLSRICQVIGEGLLRPGWMMTWSDPTDPDHADTAAGPLNAPPRRPAAAK